MDTALAEITLVLFTTIAPAGVVGYLVMALAAVCSRERERADRISHYLVVPLVLVISGLIASATHLGTPANALYVITGVGRSPLSNEVVAAVAFLVLGGVYWIVSFRDDIGRTLRVAWLGATMFAGLVLVGFVAVAYSVPSVPTWSLPTAPATLWLNALSSGPAVGLFGLLLAGVDPGRKMSIAVLAVAAVAAVTNAVVLMLEWQALADVVTTATRAVDLVPAFPGVAVGYVLLNAASVALCTVALLRRPRKPVDPFAAAAATARAHRRGLALVGAGTLLALLACFAVRFAFYAMHMTLGV